MTLNAPGFLPPAAPAEGGANALRRSRPRGPYKAAFKRILDVTAVVLAAPVVLALVGVLALAVRRDGGPAFYCQERVGRGGRSFRMWKLRSMVPDADAVFDDYLRRSPAARAEWDHTQKLRDDPRITPLGRLLRKSSLDELPQLWNVLTGDMSLVGPRPMMTSQRPLYPGSAYYRLRPGLTGPWQVAERSATSFAARADFDAAYERDLSLATDLRLLARTVRVVLKGTGC